MEKISQRAQRSIVLLKQNFILLKRTGKIPGDSYLEHTSREIHIYDRCEMKILHWVLPGLRQMHPGRMHKVPRDDH